MHAGILFATLAGLAAAGSHVAYPERRAVKNPIEDVLDKLNAGIQKTEKDIRQWRGDLAGSDLLFSDANYLLNDIRQGTIVVQSAPPVKIFDGWLEPALRLDRNLDNLVNAVISQKSRVEKINRGKDIIRVLGDIKVGVDGLVRNIFVKLPTAAQTLARPISNNIVGKVDKAIRAYDNTRKSPLASNPLTSNPLNPLNSGSSSLGSNSLGSFGSKSPGLAKGGSSAPGVWAQGPQQPSQFGGGAPPSGFGSAAPSSFGSVPAQAPAPMPAQAPAFSVSQPQPAPWAPAAGPANGAPGGWSPQPQQNSGAWSPSKSPKKGFRRSRLV